MDRSRLLRARIRALTWVFIAALVVSGATAIPLRAETKALVDLLGLAPAGNAGALASWLFKVQRALESTGAQHPFLFYGTDWLAFGHFVIAIAFSGALRDPVRNSWLFSFGMIACILVIPYAFVFGAIRGIPIWWRMIDCSFGVFGFIPLWLCHRWAAQLEQEVAASSSVAPQNKTGQRDRRDAPPRLQTPSQAQG